MTFGTISLRECVVANLDSVNYPLLDWVTQNMEPPLPKFKYYQISNVIPHASNAMSK